MLIVPNIKAAFTHVVRNLTAVFVRSDCMTSVMDRSARGLAAFITKANREHSRQIAAHLRRGLDPGPLASPACSRRHYLHRRVYLSPTKKKEADRKVARQLRADIQFNSVFVLRIKAIRVSSLPWP